MAATGISYLTWAWNPVTGCTPVGGECTDCWAQKCLSMGRSGGKPAPIVHRDRLGEPWTWRKPRERVGVCFMGDLFHEDLPDDTIDHVLFPVHTLTRHGWFILTKRAARMRAFFEYHRVPRNAWIGVTMGKQDSAHRLADLVNIRDCLRWVSVEPMLGPISLGFAPVHWVVIGCHNGILRDRCKLDHVRDLVLQCRDRGAGVYVKQLCVDGRVTDNPADWPEDLRVQELPARPPI